jgi:hypothetical protein
VPSVPSYSWLYLPLEPFNSGRDKARSPYLTALLRPLAPKPLARPRQRVICLLCGLIGARATPPNQLTASVADSPSFGNNFVSAVGPTLQVGSNTAAQIFYVAGLKSPGTGLDTLTVTFSGSASTSGCVFVEYQGADPKYPLDSVSAGYSYGAGSLLDSGTAAPANANLLVFGGGTTDAANLVNLSVVSPFTAITANLSSITEQYINTSPNNTLQRAQASSTASGNWLMQMAVFRDASWTVTGGWNPARPAQVQFADQFTGTDACARAQAAANTTINNVPTMVVDSRGEIMNGIPCATPPQFATGGEWLLPAGQFQISTPLIALAKTQHRGVCISYDVAHCSGFQSAWASGTGGLGGVPQGSYNGGTTYFSGNTATCNGLVCPGTATWYSVINTNAGNTPGAGSGNWWSLASNFPSPVAETNMLTSANSDIESTGFHDLSFNCQYAGGASNVPTLGCAGFINTWGQEQTEMDQIRITNPTVAGIWLNSPLVANSGPYGPGTVAYGSTTQHNNAAWRAGPVFRWHLQVCGCPVLALFARAGGERLDHETRLRLRWRVPSTERVRL